MSHDQRPGKVRVVQAADVARRRDDPVPVAATEPFDPTVAPQGKAALLIPALLFLIAAAIGGIAQALLLP